MAPITSDVSLAPLALYEMQRASVENPYGAIFYSDEDHLDLTHARCRPWLKTDWDPDLMLGRNLLGQFSTYRREILTPLSIPTDTDPEALLYALALEATWSVAPPRIIHVAKLLAHRSTNVAARPPDLRVVAQRFLRASGSAAEVSSASLAPHFNRVIWPLPQPSPLVTVIIPTRDGAELLARSTSAVLERTDYDDLELLIVHNGTVEPVALALLATLRATPKVRVLAHPGPFNYAAMNNHAAAAASGEVLVLLNSDTDVLKPDWLREMVAQACRPDVGVVGAKLLYEEGLVQHAGVVFNDDLDIVHQLRLSASTDPGENGELAMARTVLAVTGACLAIRKDVFVEIGSLDEANFPVAFNDIDLCSRAGDHGYRVVITPFAELMHLESASLNRIHSGGKKRDRYLAERRRFHAFWTSVVTFDPFHNPNLAYGWEKTQLATPPREHRPIRFLARFNEGATLPANHLQARILQRLAISRAFSSDQLRKSQEILAIVRGSEATAIQQRDAALRALEEAQSTPAPTDPTEDAKPPHESSNEIVSDQSTIGSRPYRLAKLLRSSMSSFFKSL